MIIYLDTKEAADDIMSYFRFIDNFPTIFSRDQLPLSNRQVSPGHHERHMDKYAHVTRSVGLSLQ